MASGITISQEGIDVDRALDSQKVLDSGWRYFETAFEVEVSVGQLNFDVVKLFEHKLGFVPAFDCWNITLGVYVLADDFGGLRANKDTIYFDGQDVSNIDHSNCKFLLRVYNVPILEEYEAPIVGTLPVGGSVSSSMGIKIVALTGSIDHQELSEFTLNTRGKALSIQKTGVAVANAGTSNLAVITHNIGNPPTYLAAFTDATRTWVGAINPDFVPVKSIADGKTLTFSGAQSPLDGQFAYIIFKELADFAL